jgi:Bacterial sugar transferase
VSWGALLDSIVRVPSFSEAIDRICAIATGTESSGSRSWDESDRTRGFAPLARVGEFLYLTRIEDLPHLFNMLCGDFALFSNRYVIS